MPPTQAGPVSAEMKVCIPFDSVVAFGVDIGAHLRHQLL